MVNQFQPLFINYKKDAYIVLEGKPAECFFIIQQGKARVTREASIGSGAETLVPGDLFGVISAMSSHKHIETVQALSDVTLISVTPQQYIGLIQKSAQVAMKILKLFSIRLRYLNETLAGLAQNTAENDHTKLYDVAEYFYNEKLFELACYAYTQYVKYCPNHEHVSVVQRRLAQLENYSANAKIKFGSELNRSYRRNNMIFAEGEPGNELFVIQKGSVKITKIVDNHEVLLAMLKVGDIFGEMALLEGKPRAACAIAYEECTVMTVSKENFEVMCKAHPQLIDKVTTLLAERIWLIYKQLANTLIENQLCRLYDSLIIQLEKNRISLESREPYTFGFGRAELSNMVGLSERESRSLINEMFTKGKIRLVNEKIFVPSVVELFKETEILRKMEKLAQSRKNSDKES